MAEQKNKAQEFVDEFCEAEVVRMQEDWAMIQERCQSPIEEIMAAALYADSKTGFADAHFIGLTTVPDEPQFYGSAFIYQQAEVGNYRADFLIVDATRSNDPHPVQKIIVECDGHDFHERTKAQARRDKQRDRWFQASGYKVFRFTGSELWADPASCSAEVFEQLGWADAFRLHNT